MHGYEITLRKNGERVADFRLKPTTLARATMHAEKSLAAYVRNGYADSVTISYGNKITAATITA